jgi:pimeloyl-CoA synthetase
MNEEELNSRIKNALAILSEGNAFRVGDLTFSTKKDTFLVSGWTLCNELHHLTKTKASSELNEIKVLFNNMVLHSPELERYIQSLQIEFSLMHDYGMGGVEICREKNGDLQWIIELA